MEAEDRHLLGIEGLLPLRHRGQALRALAELIRDAHLRANREVARLVAYYRSRPDIAFSTRPKNMELMEGQPYSLAFRKRFPKFNGLIWSYHWLQMTLYDALLAGTTMAERRANVAAVTDRPNHQRGAADDVAAGEDADAGAQLITAFAGREGERGDGADCVEGFATEAQSVHAGEVVCG